MSQLFDHQEKESGPVECLGQTFPNDDARREHFLKLLAAKLKDPEFRNQEGFPDGTDEAILEMSDPPFYTACPNPWLQDFVDHNGRPYDSEEPYSRKPMAIDVSIGKSDAIYKAHSYHTKVPHLAIVPSILHFTQPGDIVLDGFGGSGMTGIAAQWCGVASDEYRHKLEMDWKEAGFPPPKWGARKAVLNELSPAATSIAAGLNFPFDLPYFSHKAETILNGVESDLGWMFETIHTDGKTPGKIDFTVWSEVFNCNNCAGEIVFFNEAFNPETKKVEKEIECPHCSSLATKENMNIVMESFYDEAAESNDRRPKRVPVLIKYQVGKKTFEKKPDDNDIEILQKVKSLARISHSAPTTFADQAW